MLVILFNLNFIHDDVIKAVDFKPGWRYKLKEEMEKFKSRWEATYKKKWMFTAESYDSSTNTYLLQEEYIQFKQEQ